MRCRLALDLRIRFSVVAFLAASVVATVTIASAQDGSPSSLRQTTSLAFVPDDASIYVSQLHNRQQYADLVGSRAFQRLLELPAVQMATMLARFQWSNPDNEMVAAVKEFLEATENRPLIALVGDAVSQEIFFYAGPGCSEQLALFNQVNRAVNLAQFKAVASDETAQAIVAKRVLAILERRADQIRIPKMILGFRVSDVARANAQLARLESLLRQALAGVPALAERVSREDHAGTSWLSLRLDGSLIPWDELPLHEDDLDADQQARLRALIEKFKQKRLAISLGVWKEYLLLVVGENNHAAKTLGKARLLVDRKEMVPLGSAGAQTLTSIGYISGDFAEAASGLDDQIDYGVQIAEQMLPIAEIPKSLQKELAADIRQLGEDIKRYLPIPGAMMRFVYRTARGYEGVTHNWSRHVGLDGSAPLSILDHLGGHPLFFAAGRGTATPDGYPLLVKWFKRAVYYAEQLVVPALEDPQQERYKKLRPQLVSIAHKLDTVVRERLAPALADRQVAIVVRAAATSRQWHVNLPASNDPLPMFELAVAHGLSNADLFRQGCSECFELVQETIDRLHEAIPDDVPKIDLPRPASEETDQGWIHAYPLPQAWGFDPQIAPNMGWSDDVVVCSLFPQQTQQMMKKQALDVAGPLAEHDRPLAAAVYGNFAGFVETIGAWIDYAVLQSFPANDGDAIDPTTKGLLDQIHTGLNILGCFRDFSSATVIEDGAMVTYYQWHFEDLP